MTKPFPPIMFRGVDEPLRLEGDVFDLEVFEGSVPDDIDGMMAQAVPEHQFPPETAHITAMDASANGDGAVRTFRFQRGHVDFKRRYVRTERFLAERAARRALFGHYRNPFSDDPSVAGKDRTTANTAVYMHAGVMLASKEDGPPYALDPLTLETHGPWRAGGAITSRTWTAHPKFDARTGEMIGFGYAAKGECTPDIAYYVIDRNGRVKHQAWFQAPVAAMIHDCAATEHYTVFPIMPFTSSLERLRAGGLHFQYEPDMPQYFGVIPRYGSADQVRWFRAPPAFPGHTVNAFDRGGKICFDLLEANGNAFGPMFPDKDGNIAPLGSLKGALVRWTIDYHDTNLELGPAARQELAPVTGEGPHIDERRAQGDYRYAWVPGLDMKRLATDAQGRPIPAIFNTLTRIDLHGGPMDEWFAGAGATFQDPVHVPRAGATTEGAGYLLAILNWVESRRTELVVLNAMDLAAGPLARIRVPVCLRTGIHATWIPAALLGQSP
jgi:carotenoid cleavage dioxygenase